MPDVVSAAGPRHIYLTNKYDLVNMPTGTQSLPYDIITANNYLYLKE